MFLLTVGIWIFIITFNPLSSDGRTCKSSDTEIWIVFASSGGRWLWGINFLRSSFAPDVSASLYFIKGLEVKITRLQTFMVSLLGAIFLSASANSQAIFNPDNKLCIFAQKRSIEGLCRKHIFACYCECQREV